MRTIHTEIGVLAPVDIVWEVLTDFDKWEDWNPVMRVLGKAEQGAKLMVILSPPGAKPITLQPKIVKLEEGRELRWRVAMAVPFLFSAEHGFRVVAEDIGRCRFEQFESFKGLVAPAMLSRSEKAIQTGFVAMNRALKRDAERLSRERA